MFDVEHESLPTAAPRWGCSKLTVSSRAGAAGNVFLRPMTPMAPDDELDARREGASAYAVYGGAAVQLVRPAMATLAASTLLGPPIVAKSRPMRMGGASFVVIPARGASLLAQRHFVEGIALGGLKG